MEEMIYVCVGARTHTHTQPQTERQAIKDRKMSNSRGGKKIPCAFAIWKQFILK